ncbi:MAG: 3-oxoacyl-ACP reductase FabG [Deltaproteobacteria bacterium]|nr:3-oxoacyl-ACP reductase FabG [Deltaproteobacteria bacterium]
MKLEGKVAIVTGAGKGIGRGIALELAAEGADVTVNYAHSEAGAREIAQGITDMGRRAIAVRADVSRITEIEAMVETTWRQFGRIDILVNNTGITEREKLLDITEEFWDRTIDINLKGAFFCMQAVARKMVKTGGGKIINLSSVHSKASMEGVAPYAASKGGINSLTVQAALELAHHKINVNAIAPGVIEVEKLVHDPLYDREHRAQQIAWGRVGFPEDIGKAVVFLASSDSDYITGQVLFVDGGLLARLPLKRGGRPKG